MGKIFLSFKLFKNKNSSRSIFETKSKLFNLNSLFILNENLVFELNLIFFISRLEKIGFIKRAILLSLNSIFLFSISPLITNSFFIFLIFKFFEKKFKSLIDNFKSLTSKNFSHNIKIKFNLFTSYFLNILILVSLMNPLIL